VRAEAGGEGLLARSSFVSDLEELEGFERVGGRREGEYLQAGASEDDGGLVPRVAHPDRVEKDVHVAGLVVLGPVEEDDVVWGGGGGIEVVAVDRVEGGGVLAEEGGEGLLARSAFVADVEELEGIERGGGRREGEKGEE
jgi:hypothetical protein